MAPRRTQPPRAGTGCLRLVVGLTLFGSFAILGLLIGGAFAIASGALDDQLPSTDLLQQLPPQSSVIYAADHTVLATLDKGEKRLAVPLNQVSPNLLNATIATEDASFFNEGAIDWRGILRAIWIDVTTKSLAQGGSTITQQLVKNALTERQSRSPISALTVRQKIDEGLLAARVERQYTKQQILEMYVNRIYYGHLFYGIEAASQGYFGIPASKLDLAQGSLLAGLPQAPSAYDPKVHLDRAKARQQEVLRRMVAVGMISEEDATKAAAQPLTFQSRQTAYATAPAFVQWVQEELATRLGADRLAAGGLQVTTTIDLARQRVAEQAIKDQVAKLQANHATDGALVSIDPRTGYVTAMVGSAGPDVPGGEINMVTSPRQPGSAFKPLSYAAAINAKKVTMATLVQDAPFQLPKGGGPDGQQPWRPLNYDRTFHGTLPLGQCLGNSLNIPAVKVELAAGLPGVLAMARAAGLESLSQPDAVYQPSLTLGTYGVPLLEMAASTATFATLGIYRPPTGIVEVKDSQGQLLYAANPAENSRRAFDAGVAFIVGAMLSDNANRILEFGQDNPLTLPGHQVAAKTGTTEDFRDNLTVGYTPGVATAVWVGNADNSPMVNTTGVTGAAPAWHAYMLAATSGEQPSWFQMPSNVVAARVDTKTGLAATTGGVVDYFLAGTEPAAWKGGTILISPDQPLQRAETVPTQRGAATPNPRAEVERAATPTRMTTTSAVVPPTSGATIPGQVVRVSSMPSSTPPSAHVRGTPTANVVAATVVPTATPGAVRAATSTLSARASVSPG